MPKLKSKKEMKEMAVAAADQREVVYPEITANVCSGETAITVEDARELLGWEEVTEGGNYVREIFAMAKIRVRCRNNVTNRPLYANVVQTLKQDILRKRWLLNGEPIIVGRTGLLLNGQHTLLALVLANLEWESDKERWSEYWPTAPTIDKIVVSGIDESDGTVNTMDTCKPRSLADVIYRSDYFSKITGGERRIAAKMTEYAIKLLWFRTGAKHDAFAPLLTHSEALAFLASHGKILDAICHVHEEDGREGRLRRYVSPGYMAGLLYLMGCSSTDPESYRAASHPDETSLDWKNWPAACDFIVLLAAGGKETAAIRQTMAQLIEEGRLGNADRWAIIANAWLAYSNGDAITEESLQLEYYRDDEGGRHLVEQPSVGGIDLGDPSTADEADVAVADPKPDEIAKEAAKVKAKNFKKLQGEDVKVKPKLAKPSQPHRAGPNWAEGDIAWVRDPDGEHFLGQITESPWNCDNGDCLTMVRTSKGEEWEVKYSDLSLEKPSDKTQPKAAAKFLKTQPKKSLPAEYKVGDKAWAWDKGGDHWQGRVIELSKNSAKLKVNQGFQGCGTIRMVWLKDLRREQPNGHETA